MLGRCASSSSSLAVSRSAGLRLAQASAAGFSGHHRHHSRLAQSQAKAPGRGWAAINKDIALLSAPAASAVLPAASAPRRGFADFPDHFKVSLPALSPTMEVGSIISWEKKEGEELNEGDLLCEIETDKATMGFETPEEGYLAKIILEAGARDVPVGRLLCIIVSDKEDVEKFKDFKDDGAILGGAAPPPKQEAPAAAAPAPAASSQATVSAPPPAAAAPLAAPAQSAAGRVFASPAAKRIAAEKNIDLSALGPGSGMDGMITTKDLEGVAPGTGAAGMAAAQGSMIGGMPTPMGTHTDAELTSMRKTIAKRLQASKLEIPHYYLTILSLRKDINATYEKEGIKLSVNDFIIKAVALASMRVPACNSAWMGTAIREFHTCDVSVAVDTGSGLITPIVTGAESMGLAQISETVKELAGRAKQGKLQPHEFQGGTITLSNLGMFGIEHFTAIINPPQACILAVGGTSQKMVSPGAPPVSVMKVTLSCDHRVVDGAVGAQWLQYFKKFVERPQSMLL